MSYTYFGQIGISTYLALQNDHQHLSFVKDICVAGKKMARNGCKMTKHKNCLLFLTDQTLSSIENVI